MCSRISSNPTFIFYSCVGGVLLFSTPIISAVDGPVGWHLRGVKVEGGFYWHAPEPGTSPSTARLWMTLLLMGGVGVQNKIKAYNITSLFKHKIF